MYMYIYMYMYMYVHVAYIKRHWTQKYELLLHAVITEKLHLRVGT